jgi:anti-anti-sigma regulatory factor
MATGALKIRRSRVQGMDSIEIAGPFDCDDPLIESTVSDILREGKKDIAMDFSTTTYITSPGVGCLIKTIKRVQAAGGILHIHGATEDMVEYLTMNRIASLVKII